MEGVIEKDLAEQVELVLDRADIDAEDKPVNANPLLSQKPIPARDRLIFALDVPTVEEAKKLVKALGDSITWKSSWPAVTTS